MNILSIIGIAMALSMFFLKREWKITLIFIAIICFSLVSVPYLPIHVLRTVLCYMFFLSELNHIKKHCKALQKTVIWRLLVIQLIATIISFATSPHCYSSAIGIEFIIFELLSYNILIAYAYISIRNEQSFKVILKGTFAALLVLTVFGIFNLSFKKADFVNYAMIAMGNIDNGMELPGNRLTDAERFRVQAMFYNPFDYGYICLILFFLHLYGYFKKFEKKRIAYVALACCLFGILYCGCRTMIFCFTIGIAIFMLLGFKIGKGAKYSLIIIMTIALAYNFVPIVQEKMDQALTVVTDTQGDEIEGSSLEMRATQVAAVMYHINGHVLFGRGRGYFNLDLGWAEGKNSLKDTRLAGLEGIYLNYLLERGIIGFSLWILFYVLLIQHYIKNRRYDKQTAAMGLAIVGIYIAFSCMTGELLSLFPTMLTSGLFLKLLDIAKKRHTKLNVKNEILSNHTGI